MFWLQKQTNENIIHLNIFQSISSLKAFFFRHGIISKQMEDDFRIRDGAQSYNNYKWRKQPELTVYGIMYQKMSIESKAEPSAGVHYKAQSG